MALSTQDLFEIRKIIVAAKLLDSKAFDADIKRMEEASALQQQIEISAIASAQEKSFREFETFKASLVEQQEISDKQLKAIKDKNKLLDEKQAEINKTAAEVGAQMDALAVSIKTTQESVDAMTAEAQSRIQAVEQRERDVNLREQALAQGQQELAVKLETLKALSS